MQETGRRWAASDGLVAPRVSLLMALLMAREHFQAKRIPVRVKKMRENKDLELLSDSAEAE
jgi:hypothetical protein